MTKKIVAVSDEQKRPPDRSGTRILLYAGEKFGLLTVIRAVDRAPGHKSVAWECCCDCGKTAYVKASNLRRGLIKSCGCRRNREISASNARITMEGLKQCTKCKEIKLLTEFFRFRAGVAGRSAWCKVCSMAQKREYTEKNRDRLNAWKRGHYAANIERYRKKTRTYIKGRRTRRWLKKYGLTEEQYDRLVEAQDGRCAICLADNPRRKGAGVWFVDHDHKTGRVRGLLCSFCNLILGFLDDNPMAFERAAAYLSCPPAIAALAKAAAEQNSA